MDRFPKTALFLLGFLGTLCISVSLAAQESESGLDVRREAATLEGLRKLMDKVTALKVTPTVEVKEFVSQSPALSSALLRTLRDRSRVEERSFRDGSREVDILISVDGVIEALQNCAQENKEAAKAWPAEAFRQIKDFAARRDIEVTGASNSEDSARAVLGQGVAEPGLAWAQVKEPGSLKARSAAEENAADNLFKMALNLRLGPGSRLGDFVESADTLRRIREFVRTSAEPVPMSLRYIEDLTCEVEMEISVETVLGKMDSLVQSRLDAGLSKLAGHALADLVKENGRKILRATGLGFPPDEYLPLPARRRPPWARSVLQCQGEGFPPEDLPSSEAAKNLGFSLAKRHAARKLLAEISLLTLGQDKTIGGLLDERRKADLVRIIDEHLVRDIGFGKGVAGKVAGYAVEIEINLWKIWNLVREWR